VKGEEAVALAVRLMDDLVSDPVGSVFAVEAVRFLRRALLEGAGGEERFEGGTRIKAIVDGPVLAPSQGIAGKGVGIEARLVRHGQDFSRLGVHDYGESAFRAFFRYGLFQL